VIGTASVPVSITGLGAHVPDRVLTNHELSTIVETSDEWIMERTGIRERRIAAPEEALSDLALPAVERALAEAGVSGGDIDLLICATVTPDMMFPTTSALLADIVGAADAAAYDLLAGCTGFMYALAQAYGMIAADLSQRALVVGGDVLSRILDWTDRSTLVLFGDGAGAVVLLRQRVRPDERPRGLQVRDPRAGLVGAGASRSLRGERRGRRRLRPASGERPDHQPRRPEARRPERPRCR
jgi:3-oxoacyl-[acyl-carrier-protein] synthase-3